jgi:hypothetical protein
MLRSTTTVIVGAGASKEFGFPLGAELLDQVRKLLTFGHDEAGRFRGDYNFLQRLEQVVPQAELVARRIVGASAHATSIDGVLDRFSDDVKVNRVGKIAISKLILAAEAKSAMNLEPHRGDHRSTINFAKVGDNWLGRLLAIAQQRVRLNEPQRVFSNVSFVVFNYDRCLEHYLFHALKQAFMLSEDETANVMKGIKVFTPMASLADYRGKIGFKARA